MILSMSISLRIWLATSATDLRKSFDTLAELVRQQRQADPLSDQLIVFHNKLTDRVKLLYADDGFVILFKRLKEGRWCFRRLTSNVFSSARMDC